MTLIDDNDLPEVGDGVCCWGAAMRGPGGCTCWRSEHDLEQADPDPLAVRLLAGGIEPTVRATMCGDCAYRPGSPEKRGDPEHAGCAESLEHFAAAGDPFWCHDGMRRVVKQVHPAGVEIPGSAAAYDPPIVNGVPYRADGQPGFRCAGCDARRRAIAAEVRRG